jgi:hypothetical protein
MRARGSYGRGTTLFALIGACTVLAAPAAQARFYANGEPITPNPIGTMASGRISLQVNSQGKITCQVVLPGSAWNESGAGKTTSTWFEAYGCASEPACPSYDSSQATLLPEKPARTWATSSEEKTAVMAPTIPWHGELAGNVLTIKDLTLLWVCNGVYEVPVSGEVPFAIENGAKNGLHPSVATAQNAVLTSAPRAWELLPSEPVAVSGSVWIMGQREQLVTVG